MKEEPLLQVRDDVADVLPRFFLGTYLFFGFGVSGHSYTFILKACASLGLSFLRARHWARVMP